MSKLSQLSTALVVGVVISVVLQQVSLAKPSAEQYPFADSAVTIPKAAVDKAGKLPKAVQKKPTCGVGACGSTLPTKAHTKALKRIADEVAKEVEVESAKHNRQDDVDLPIDHHE